MLLKKVTIFILLGIFLFNTAGYFIAFKILQYQIRKEIKAEIKQQLDPSECTIITIAKREITSIAWEDDGEEFYYKGELYDIIRSTETKDSITFCCINDEKEEELLEKLNDHIDRHSIAYKSLKNRSAKKLNNPVKKLFFQVASSSFLSATNRSIRFPSDYFYYTPVFIEIVSPPPELA